MERLEIGVLMSEQAATAIFTRERLGREPINLQGVRLARVRYCPDSGQIPQRSEMS
jgi:hypothetical protein